MTAPHIPSPAQPAEQRPSRFMAMLYLIVGIAALVLANRSETAPIARYVIGIVVEIALALLALVFMRLERLPISDTARLRRPRQQHVLLALAVVPGMWMTGVGLNLIALLVLGYSSPVTPAMFPENVLQAIVLALTTMVVAPICEELMFRGYVQRGFERGGMWTGVVVGGLIFAIYHLRFQGVFALIPVAVALGFVAWRTQSLFPPIAMHAAYNTIATILLVATSFLPMDIVGGLTATLVCMGILITPFSYIALWMLWRATRPEAVAPAAPQRGIKRWGWALLLVALLGVYGYAAVTEFIVGRFPERVLTEPIRLEPAPAWREPARWNYVVQNLTGRDLGEAACTRSPQDDGYALSCQADYEGYSMTEEFPGLTGFDEMIQDLTLPAAVASAIEVQPRMWVVDAVWSDALDLREVVAEEETPDYTARVVYPSPEGEITVTWPQREGDVTTINVPDEDVFVLHEWAWRLSAMPLELPYGGPITLVSIGDNGAEAYDAFVSVQGGEPAWTPGGNYVAWRVNVTYTDAAGRERTLSAWYDTAPSPTLVRYDDGAVSYLLTETERAGRALQP